MAPFKRISIAFLLAFAVVAATLQPSAAIREAVAKEDQEASMSATGEASHPSARPRFPGLPLFPALPPLPSLPPWARRRPIRPLPPIPCIPGLPRLPFLPPCTPGSQPSPSAPTPPSPPQPAECHTPLAGLMPCADFLTNTSASAPPSACCDGLKSVASGAPICMCHVMNGDFGKLLPAPMLRLRMMQLPRVCGASLPLGTLRQCIRGPVPPMNPPPSTPTLA
ncbi:uncharacterized protein LOC133893240 [Phragmites australis]|uniref:uncharacterized protein LOC133893240 n=1 Tax=Phragmites australis TaxID=29695 RepID=UPI002D7A0D6E|nr:uncharacterized protein LOC133893240 [Phragmites australis]